MCPASYWRFYRLVSIKKQMDVIKDSSTVTSLCTGPVEVYSSREILSNFKTNILGVKLRKRRRFNHVCIYVANITLLINITDIGTGKCEFTTLLMLHIEQLINLISSSQFCKTNKDQNQSFLC